jgi:hypothetical protein
MRNAQAMECNNWSRRRSNLRNRYSTAQEINMWKELVGIPSETFPLPSCNLSMATSLSETLEVDCVVLLLGSTEHLHHYHVVRSLALQFVVLLPSSHIAHSTGKQGRIHPDHALCDRLYGIP